MENSHLKTLKPEEFRRLTGVKAETFAKMLAIIQKAIQTKKAKVGRPNKLSCEQMFLMTLEYLRGYRTYFHISKSYGISESNCYYTIRFIEEALIKSGQFTLPGRKALLKSDMEYAVILIDATESPIERPKKKQRYYYSGKKKRHTLKTQLVVDKQTRAIICSSFSNGKRHDFRLFKESKVHISQHSQAIVDTGYQGLKRLHDKSLMPKKRSKKHPLTKADKRSNQQLASQRVLSEHIIGMLKRFKILAERYRNRRKRFGLRFNLIAGIYNYELLC
ncbi:IS5-like element ISCaa3 family transposase [Candidatus Amoebophilus asiaticus]|uniref:IS5-like element ISCaa3 family transposase n=1 Tax=Candidatus Amoebophilus asiaticus TaxID=281120 RepID=UPI0011D11F37|nr:IS5-like element ISCaa3 family transposase [Candidatus Amoebophilus asiaticus]